MAKGPIPPLPDLAATPDELATARAVLAERCRERGEEALALEYLAGEKPVVSTALPDVVSLYGDLVHVAREPRDFLAACEAALAPPRCPRFEADAGRLATVHHASWPHLGAFIHELLERPPSVAAARTARAAGSMPAPMTAPMTAPMKAPMKAPVPAPLAVP